MSGHVRTSQGPQKHLRPQRVQNNKYYAECIVFNGILENICGSDSGTAVCTPEGGSCEKPSLPEESYPPYDDAIDTESSSGAPKEKCGASKNGPTEIP